MWLNIRSGSDSNSYALHHETFWSTTVMQAESTENLVLSNDSLLSCLFTEKALGARWKTGEERQGIKNFKGYKSGIYEEKLYFSFVLRKFILFCNTYTINVSEHVFCQEFVLHVRCRKLSLHTGQFLMTCLKFDFCNYCSRECWSLSNQE